MDPELKDYLDRMFVAITDQIGRLDQRILQSARACSREPPTLPLLDSSTSSVRRPRLRRVRLNAAM